MHVYHITENHSPTNPGVTAVVNQVSKYLVTHGFQASVLTTGDPGAAVPEGAKLEVFPLSIGWRRWRYSARMSSYLSGIGGEKRTIFHLHGVWFAPQWLSARAALRRDIPMVLSPHSMLEPWHWRKSRVKRIKKLAYWRTLAYPVFRHVSLIHAVSALERDNLARLFPGRRITLIPNALDLAEVDGQLANCIGDTPYNDRPFILFLGRLDAQKGLDVLIRAFASLPDKKEFRLLIVGPETDRKFSVRVKSLVQSMGLERDVVFVGPVFGSQKWAYYRNAWVLCVPSRSEGLSSVQLEAAAAQVPIVTSHSAGFPELQNHGGILVNPEADQLTSVLHTVLSWGDSERMERGRRLRALVEQHFSAEAVGPAWIRLYDEFVRMKTES